MPRKNRKNRGTRIALTVLCVVLGIIFTLLLAATIFVNSILNRIGRVEETVPTLSVEEEEHILFETDPPEEFNGEVLEPEEVTLPTEPAQIIETEDHVVNILLIGQDRRPGEGRQRSDAMILCTINTEEKTLTMTSFLRDLYVRFPDYNGRSYYDNRINATYAIGGMEMLNDCLKLNFGIEVDHNIEVDFSGFETIVDKLGGVNIELTGDEAYVVGGGARAGMNRLNGQQALTYSRIRSLDNDFGRTNRQRKVLSAILGQVRDLNIQELTELTESVFPLITTDMSNAEIIKYVFEFFPLLEDLEITTQHVPGDGMFYFANIRGMSVLVPDTDAICEMLKESIGS